MKNDYEIRGDVTVIFLDRKDGTRLECLIDTVDLPRAMEFPWKWSPHWDRHTLSFYAEGKSYRKGQKREHFSLHRWLCNPPESYEVDHINHNTLDNRRSSNLRVIPKGANQQNYKGARKHNKSSGVRGVSWHYPNQKWRAAFRVNNKTYHVGLYDTVEEAEKAVIAARLKYMPYSIDNANTMQPDKINPCFESGIYSTNTSGYRGLIHEKKTNKWYGRIQRKGIVVKIKPCKTKEEAYKKLCEKAKLLGVSL
ncbi:MAG: AP2 domain protein [Pelotomaculum sp. PtaU1.Bin035]|nr:MAG: AP2 domain protein [Pelotomaculum sp. PtaU1.Bin035]